MNHWVLGKRGVAPVKNPKRRGGKRRRRNPNVLSANDKKIIRQWAKRQRKNPVGAMLEDSSMPGSLSGLSADFAKDLAGSEGLMIAPSAREIEESKGWSKKEMRRRAGRRGVPGRSKMNKEQLRASFSWSRRSRRSSVRLGKKTL